MSGGLRAGAALLKTLALIVIDALALFGLSAVLPKIDVPSLGAALLTAVVIAVFNGLLWPLLTRVALPLTVLTFGLGTLVLNALVIMLAIRIVDGEAPEFIGALMTAVGLALVSMVAIPALDIDGDARHLHVVRRRSRHVRKENTTDVPGVILFEIDGLGEEELRLALREGHAPTMARWLEEGSHRIVPWECDLSSQTGASQAGLLLGSNFDMPAFRWYEKETGRLMVSNKPSNAAEMERRHSDGAGLLAAGGGSRGNLLSGDAPRCMATMSVIRDKQRSQPGEFFAYFSDPYGFIRTIARFFGDVVSELVAARGQRRRGEPHVARGGIYPFARASITVVMRDLNVAALLGDIVEGLPVAYATFVGYDEVAHHSGVVQPDAFAVLKRLDRELSRLERAVAQAPRPYHLVVLSDHGQTQGAPFRQRHGETLEELVRRTLADASVHAPAPVDEGLAHLGAAMAEARESDDMSGRLLRRATADRMVDGNVDLGSERGALTEHAGAETNGDAAADVIVLASGCLGLISFPAVPERMTQEQIEAAHPGLIAALCGHPGIGFVMVRTREEGAMVLGGAGRRRLADDDVEGTDPLAAYDATAADHLRRTDSFPHCPDLLVNGRYHPESGEIEPFEEFMGSHGGLGGTQMHPFGLVPSEWSPAPEPIVGAAAMHEALRGWMREIGLEVKERPRLTAAPGASLPPGQA